MTGRHETPVCIVGAGPIGMMVALTLQSFGVKCMLVEKELNPCPQPRGNTHNARTMELYRRRGLSAGIRQNAWSNGLGLDRATDVAYVTRLTGYELARIPMPSESEKAQQIAEANAGSQICEPLLRCNQMYVEQVVFDHVTHLHGIDCRLGWCCIASTQDADGVTVTLREEATGTTEEIRCLYLVGSDGGQSSIRRSLGIRYVGEDVTEQAYFGSTMVSTRIRAPGLLAKLPHRSAWQYWIVNPDIRANVIQLNADDEWLLHSQLPSPDSEPDDQLVAERFTKIVGKDVEFEMVSHWTFTPGRALVASKFREGRIILAGDSIHLFSPTGGFGMNTGMEDAVNLGWKLAALADGWGGEQLLETYELERRPIAFRNTGAAKFFTRNVGNVPVPAELEDDDAAGEAARRTTGDFLATFTEEFASIGIQLGARYDGSPIIIAQGAQPPKDDPFVYTASSVPGGRAPHGWLPEGSSLYDQFGAGFTLLTFAAEGDTAGFEKVARELNIPLHVVAVDVPEIAALYNAPMALIRPDLYLAWSGDSATSDPQAILRQVTGRL